MKVTFTLEAQGTRTALRLEHEGFEGLGGFFLAKLMMGPGWKKMLHRKLAAELSRPAGQSGERLATQAN